MAKKIFLEKVITITPEDCVLQELRFQPYRNKARRRAVCYQPKPGEPPTFELMTPWGEKLIVESGDYIVSELDSPEDQWSVEGIIFEKTYVEIEPGIYVKRATTDLVPLVDIVGSPDQVIRIKTMEGEVEVRAGDYYLARGIQDEIWPIPKEKVMRSMEVIKG